MSEIARPARFPFLSARWQHLCLVTYKIEPSLAEKFLPPGLEPDLIDGSAFVSLVAFDFVDTKVLGIPWPGFRNFPEINLRMYVRQGRERGVVFIRELVPMPFVAFMAKTFYNEPYAATPMRSKVEKSDSGIVVAHNFEWQGRKFAVEVKGEGAPIRPGQDSLEQFFKEHRWGYGTTASGKLARYEVWHPEWDVYTVASFTLDVDWAHVYGPDWSCLSGQTPFNVTLALGSEIAVYPLD